MEARHELHYLQHGHVNHRALQINGSSVDVFTINLVYYLPGVHCVFTLKITTRTADFIGFIY